MWNLRLVELDEGVELREVFYDDKNLPVGHSRATVYGENLNEVEQYLYWCNAAVTQPILKKQDFIGKYIDYKDDL